MSSSLPPAALLLLGIPMAVAAETPTADLATIVVTATRTAQTADDSLAPVTVITRQDIERRQARSTEDLLRGEPGITLSNNGGRGKVTSMFLRGTNSDHVLVLIDGVKVGSATTGSTAFEDLPVDLIERIEIVRGPRSSLYGSEAIGGVIQIFTRKGEGPPRPSLSFGGGSHGTWQGSAALSGGIGSQAWYSLGFAGVDTKGFNACRGDLNAGCFAVEPDKDGYRQRSGRVRAGLRFGNGAEFEVNWLRANGDSHYDGGFVNESATVQQVLSASLRFSPLDPWQSSLQIGQSLDDADNFKDGVFMSRFNTRRNTLSWQNEFELGQGQRLVAGIDWQNDRLSGATDYAVKSRDNSGVFAQYLLSVGAHDLQLSLRRDDNEQFGAKTTGGIAWGHALSDDLRLTASYGTAFKAPTFNQLYFPGFGNSRLRPEQASGIDIGLAGKIGAGRWSLNAFTTRVTDLVGYDASFTPVNVDAARIRGLEAVASAQWLGWQLRGNLGLLDPENRSSGTNHGNVLPRRARQNLSLSADRDFGAWSVGADLRGEGRRYDDLANKVELDRYATVDLRGEYRLSKDWRLQARIENLFDKDYQTANRYNQADRGAYLVLRYQP